MYRKFRKRLETSLVLLASDSYICWSQEQRSWAYCSCEWYWLVSQPFKGNVWALFKHVLLRRLKTDKWKKDDSLINNNLSATPSNGCDYIAHSFVLPPKCCL